MAIKMDNHDINKLELHGANGQTVTKQLTEELNLQTKTATENGEVTPDEGYDGLSKVNVNVQGGGGITPVTLDVHGSDANSITINMPNTAGTSCLLEYSSDADASMEENGAIKNGYNVASVISGMNGGSAKDTGGSNRTPSMTRNPGTGTITLSTTKPYPAAATYHFVYTEWTPE